jgi:hypothetical protein
MRMHLIFLLFFLSFLQGACYAQDTKKTVLEAGPQDSYSWDFGRVKEGAVLKHVFKLRNESNRALNIKEVTTSCGCTVSKAQKKTLLPKETTSIEVSFKTRGYSGPTQQYIYVNTDDLDNPLIRFIIKADVVK